MYPDPHYKNKETQLDLCPLEFLFDSKVIQVFAPTAFADICNLLSKEILGCEDDGSGVIPCEAEFTHHTETVFLHLCYSLGIQRPSFRDLLSLFRLLIINSENLHDKDGLIFKIFKKFIFKCFFI